MREDGNRAKQRDRQSGGWNPWHGCKKVSQGCKNCFVYKMDRRYGRGTTVITKGKTTYELKDKDCPYCSVVKLCFSSDFFIEEADEWRDGCWNFIRRRKDCILSPQQNVPKESRTVFPTTGARSGNIFI